ncbi:GH15 family glucan-1,4-alpha-glucosidase [Kitasatospora sp. MAA19]|uniref:glycoside hydrolase family 15 protein n=1 Tax=unclassified Kitasatospora TaxID=2633591 RepID=UPI002475132D|nr:glycoside hydrolase family 15 protein [Kitasatospora sp. MAA19]MDH6709198.1 GH15 family glucan-1,4-alpha-glucosidase [Kitasatospora sp. MAA19]
MPRTLPTPPIEDHALLGNTRSTALVTRDGAITWLCWPRPDSEAVFAALLGTEQHGFWRVAPARYDTTAPAPCARRRYRGNSLILEQEWDTENGTVRVTDFMPAPNSADPAPAQIIRVVEGLSGLVRVASEFRPRPAYGRLNPVIHRAEHHGRACLTATSLHDSYWLDGPRHSPGTQGSCRADFEVAASQTLVLALTWQPARSPALPPPDGLRELADTARYWETWSSGCTYQGPHHGAVLRAAITLKALCHMDGGIIAAPTTSLPEAIGGERNWDYRYVWPRDSALTAAALARLGHLDEARAWRDWLITTVDPANLQVLYGIDGEYPVDEHVLRHLPGYENSRPVRVGNGAVGQLQLDVPGEIADALLVAEDAGLRPDPGADALLLALAEQVEKRWREPDEGIWEVRGRRRHFTHSRLMCWVFFDRAATLLARRRTVDPAVVRHLREVRDEIHADVCANGLDPQRGVFTQYYGGRDLDAALLLIPAVGFLPGDDKRVIATVEAVQRELTTRDGLVHRYPTHDRDGANVDGLTGHEGAFLPCSFWLADALAAIGRPDEARELLDRLLLLPNDLGLLAEEYDPVNGRQLGNYPQAFTLLALADSCRIQAGPAPLPAQRTEPATTTAREPAAAMVVA